MRLIKQSKSVHLLVCNCILLLALPASSAILLNGARLAHAATTSTSAANSASSYHHLTFWATHLSAMIWIHTLGFDFPLHVWSHEHVSLV